MGAFFIAILFFMVCNNAFAFSCSETFASAQPVGRNFLLQPAEGILHYQGRSIVLTRLESALFGFLQSTPDLVQPIGVVETWLHTRGESPDILRNLVESINSKIHGVSGLRPLTIRTFNQTVVIKMGRRYDIVDRGPIRLDPITNQLFIFSQSTQNYQVVKANWLAFYALEYLLHLEGHTQSVPVHSFYESLSELREGRGIEWSDRFVRNLRSQISNLNQSYKTITGSSVPLMQIVEGQLTLRDN